MEDYSFVGKDPGLKLPSYYFGLCSSYVCHTRMTGDSRASTTSAYEPSSINKVFHVQQDGVVQILNLCKRTLFFLKMELIFETL